MENPPPVTPPPGQPTQTPPKPIGKAAFDSNRIYPQVSSQTPASTVMQSTPVGAHSNKKTIGVVSALILLILIVGLGAGLHYSKNKAQHLPSTVAGTNQVKPTSNLNKINYDNGKGVKFNLLFYPDYDIAASSTSIVINHMVSKKSVDGKAPVKLSIFSESISDGPAKKSYETGHNCGPTFPLVVQVHNSYLNQDINICEFDPLKQHKHDNYTALFYDSRYYYDAIFEQTAETPTSAVGLDVYNQDIRAITASIQPL